MLWRWMDMHSMKSGGWESFRKKAIDEYGIASLCRLEE